MMHLLMLMHLTGMCPESEQNVLDAEEGLNLWSRLSFWIRADNYWYICSNFLPIQTLDG